MSITTFLIKCIKFWGHTRKVSPLYVRTTDPLRPILVGGVYEKGGTSTPVLFLDPPAQLHRDSRSGEYWLSSDPNKHPYWLRLMESDEDYPFALGAEYYSFEKFFALVAAEPHAPVWRDGMEVLSEFQKDGNVIQRP